MPRSSSSVELRLLLEEVCCDLSRFEHSLAKGVSPGEVRVDREVSLGQPGVFADIRIQPCDTAPYFVEVKFGYSDEALRRSLGRKYGAGATETGAARRLILVVDRKDRPHWPEFVSRLRDVVRADIELEIWDEARLGDLLKLHLGVAIDRIEPEALLDVRAAIDQAKGRFAFGDDQVPYEHDPLRAQLLWHLGFWRLRELYSRTHDVRQILSPGSQPQVVVVVADMCAFSSFVRDTPDPAIVRESLTAFYSKARYQIINNGGLHYQFVGDEVIGIFGVPDHRPGYVDAAYETARSLCAIGKSAASQWQRRIDRLQSACGAHVGMAMGDLELIPQRPFSRTHIGFVGDSINLAARLTAEARCDEIVMTNSLFQHLSDRWQSELSAIGPVEAKNVGSLNAWRSRITI